MKSTNLGNRKSIVKSTVKSSKLKRKYNKKFKHYNKARESKHNYSYISPNGRRKSSNKRIILIDARNVAQTYSAGDELNVDGIEKALLYFINKGYKCKAVLPQMHMQRSRSTNQALLRNLERKGLLILTPCRNTSDKVYISDYKRFVVEAATKLDGVIISNDPYESLANDTDSFKETIVNRKIEFCFDNGSFVLKDDSRGRALASILQP